MRFIKNHPLGGFLNCLSIECYISLIISYLRSRSPKNEKPIAFFVAEADFNLILV